MFNVLVLESVNITEQMMMRPRQQTFVHYTIPTRHSYHLCLDSYHEAHE